MGKIKSKLVRRTANSLLERKIKFDEKFGSNKKTLGNTMPSKKIRNQIAGLMSRMKKQHRLNEEKMALRRI